MNHELQLKRVYEPYEGDDLENIYKTIEELSPNMIKAVDVKRLVGAKTEAASMAVAR